MVKNCTKEEVVILVNNKKHPFKTVINYYGFVKMYDRRKIRQELKDKLMIISFEFEKNTISIELIDTIHDEIEKDVDRLLSIVEKEMLTTYINYSKKSIFNEKGFSTQFIGNIIENNIIFNNVKEIFEKFTNNLNKL